jgi:hypothetical protein
MHKMHLELLKTQMKFGHYCNINDHNPIRLWRQGLWNLKYLLLIYYKHMKARNKFWTMEFEGGNMA